MSKPIVKKMKEKKDVEGLIKALKDKDWHVVNQFFMIFSE